MLETISGHELASSIKMAASRLGIESGFVRAFGFVRDVQLRADGHLIETSAATLVSLTGSVTSVNSQPVFRGTALVTYVSGGVPITVGGELVSAFADGVECWFDGADAAAPKPARRDGPPPRHAKPKPETPPQLPFEDVAPEKEKAPTPKAAAAPKPAPVKAKPVPSRPAPKPAASSPAKAKASPGDWARVLEASQNAISDEDDGEVDVDELERGDVLLHPSLDECTILAVISDDAVKVRLPNGSVRKLVMRNFQLFAEGDGMFRVEKRKKN